MSSPAGQQEASSAVRTVTCTAPVNIAVVKYWGKRDEELVLPINSSLSVTLHQDQLKSTTTVASSPRFPRDRVWLNGKEEDAQHPRLQACLREIRRLAGKRRHEEVDAESDEDDNNNNDNNNDNNDNNNDKGNGGGGGGGGGGDGRPPPPHHHLHVCSINNFPTAAGLASSASGYACLAYCAARLLGVVSGEVARGEVARGEVARGEVVRSEVSVAARLGSGSACRSVLGGFVAWERGTRPDGTDSVARSVRPHGHWPQLRALVLVVSADRKLVGSTAGMQTSVQTSELLRLRAELLVPQRMAAVSAAVAARDFPAFAELCMRDSNQFHATCLDTFPPLAYLTDASRAIAALVHALNRASARTVAAYTFDAGPNAVLFVLEEDVGALLGLLQRCFPPSDHHQQRDNGDTFIRGLPVEAVKPSVELEQKLKFEPCPGIIRYIISTQVGPGPQVLSDPDSHLLGPDGLPKAP
ncbi:diphosphomevalonate decarboxylase isoform X2 [Lampetra fluviatilis]